MKARSDESLDTPMTQMMDIVFLLIIFFVVTASVDKDVVDESINLAQAKSAPAVETVDPRAVTINLTKKGEVNIALRPMSMQALYNFLVNMRTQSGNSMPVLIRCDAKTKYKEIGNVMDTAAKAGLYRVRLVAMLDQ